MRFTQLLITWLVGFSAVAADVDLYLFTGQSNCLGTTADPGAEDSSPGSDPADGNVRLFWSNRSTRGGDGAAGLIGDSGGKFLTLRVQQGEGRNKTFWGPEIGFGRSLYAAGVRDFRLVKAARGGGGNSHWLPEGQMGRHLLATARAAAARVVASGDTPRFLALVYLQGESDSAAEAAASGARLRQLFLRLRDELDTGEMQCIVVGIAAAGASRNRVRAEQEKAAAAHPDMRYLSTLDLAPRLYDRLHFDKTAKLEIGRRIARVLGPLAENDEVNLRK